MGRFRRDWVLVYIAPPQDVLAIHLAFQPWPALAIDLVARFTIVRRKSNPAHDSSLARVRDNARRPCSHASHKVALLYPLAGRGHLIQELM